MSVLTAGTCERLRNRAAATRDRMPRWVYWAYFAAKLGVAAAALYGLLWIINVLWPPQPVFFGHSPPGYMLTYDLAVLGWFLLCSGAAYLCVWDQRHRCRVCLRRLRMPIETGSWSSTLLLGRPRIESICPYGHGTLREEELQISGLEGPQWTAHPDPWEDLCAAGKEADEDS